MTRFPGQQHKERPRPCVHVNQDPWYCPSIVGWWLEGRTVMLVVYPQCQTPEPAQPIESSPIHSSYINHHLERTSRCEVIHTLSMAWKGLYPRKTSICIAQSLYRYFPKKATDHDQGRHRVSPQLQDSCTAGEASIISLNDRCMWSYPPHGNTLTA